MASEIFGARPLTCSKANRNEENSFKQDMLFFENEIGKSTIGVPLEKKQESLQRVQADYSKEKNTDLIQG